MVLQGKKIVKMESSHSLTLNEEKLAEVPEAKRPVFIFEWLRFLDKVLVAAQKVKRTLPPNVSLYCIVRKCD